MTALPVDNATMPTIASSEFHVAVIGAGPAGLMAAETLAAGGARVTLYDHMPSAGRKFLMAGRGGLNITHSEPFENFIKRYGSAAPALRAAIEDFSPDSLRRWCDNLGQSTFVGSSGRVFPKSLKASPLLRAWLSHLRESGVRLMLRHRWQGWNSDGDPVFDHPNGHEIVRSKATVFALGGGSWPRLGPDGAWTELFTARGIGVSPLRPANSGFRVRWSGIFRDRFEGAPLKGVLLSAGAQTSRGEIVVTKDGVEGGGIYALSSVLRHEIEQSGSARLIVALRPDISHEKLLDRLSAPRQKQSLSTFLRKAAGLSPLAIGLLQESAVACGRSLSTLSTVELAEAINAVPITLVDAAPLARAISTAGGIELGEIDNHYMIKKLPGTFVAGEMIDWEAPTGGYLLQASFATGVAAGRGALAWSRRSAK